MSHLFPHWRSFQTVSSDAEAAAFSARCLFSLATLEVTCDPATNNWALTEQERPGVWRWAVMSAGGATFQEGRESSRETAKQIALETLANGSSLTAGFTKGCLCPLSA
jgi:hypothetical protein